MSTAIRILSRVIERQFKVMSFAIIAKNEIKQRRKINSRYPQQYTANTGR
jgi:hypothetical protein